MISSGNIAGGFIVTKRMLDMFKRKDDLPEYNYLYGIGGGAMIASLYAAHRAGVPHIYSMGYLASSICCLAAISGLSSQSTARSGNMFGLIGVSGGIATTVLYMNFPSCVLF